MQNDAREPQDLTEAVKAARSGLRSDVAALVRALDEGVLCVPLVKHIAGVEPGAPMELSSDLEIVPHLLSTPDDKLCTVAFTRGELLDGVAEQLDWTTEDDALEYCTLPARMVLDMALQVIDDKEVVGLVLNPLQDSELFLQRPELASIAGNQPIPLVGYVERIAPNAAGTTIVAEPGDPHPPALLAALDAVIQNTPELVGYGLDRTYDSERDLEPHLTLTLRTHDASADHDQLARRVVAAIEDKLPPPGYIDVFFELSQ